MYSDNCNHFGYKRESILEKWKNTFFPQTRACKLVHIFDINKLQAEKQADTAIRGQHWINKCPAKENIHANSVLGTEKIPSDNNRKLGILATFCPGKR